MQLVKRFAASMGRNKSRDEVEGRTKRERPGGGATEGEARALGAGVGAVDRRRPDSISRP